MRQSARLLGVSKNTIAPKLKFLASLTSQIFERDLRRFLQGRKLERIQFDDMETFHHTKMKPLSIPVVVDSDSRLILGLGVASIAAKGLLAEKSIKKYGKRPNYRPFIWNSVFRELPRFVSDQAHFMSDQDKNYPNLVKDHFPKATHKQHKGRKGCVVGQGELKKGGFDPLFSLNHTAAMMRSHVSRLARRTWVTTKKTEALLEHLSLYVVWHNQRIIQKMKLEPAFQI
jgi:hypothetical protein